MYKSKETSTTNIHYIAALQCNKKILAKLLNLIYFTVLPEITIRNMYFAPMLE